MGKIRTLLILLAAQLIMGYNLMGKIQANQQTKQHGLNINIANDSTLFLVQTPDHLYFLKK